MLRSLSLTLAALFVLAGYNLAHSQDTQPNTVNNTPAPDATNSSASADNDVTKLQAENAALKKEVADATRTIAQLQAALAQAGVTHRSSRNQHVNRTPDTTIPPASTNAAPTGPQKALPLDATNANVTAAAPGADAGPSKTYTVVKGDSIWKIAHKMYPGDTKNGVDKIQEANKDAIGGKPLKIGQVLIIPQ